MGVSHKTHKEVIVDHKNRARFNNTKKNLRLCTNSQNLANSIKSSRNTSGYKGVTWDKARNKYSAKIAGVNLGRFYSLEDAARAYNKKAIEMYGEFAKLNIITERV